jgi:hypothetical protein
MKQPYSKSNILPDFIIHTYVDAVVESYGLDTVADCFDKKYFKNYPHKVEYVFNSRGFRDIEWPESNLSEYIWCVGDSHTVGMGVPREHTWTYLLQEKTKIRTINVSMDGASNTWIARKVSSIIESVAPKNIIIQWSYIHRRERDSIRLSDEDRRLWHTDDFFDLEFNINLTFDNIAQVDTLAKTHGVNIIHTFIPYCVTQVSGIELFYDKVKQLDIHIVDYDVLDKGRDGHHYDMKTADLLTNNIVNSGLLNI